MFIFIMFVVW